MGILLLLILVLGLIWLVLTIGLGPILLILIGLFVLGIVLGLLSGLLGSLINELKGSNATWWISIVIYVAVVTLIIVLVGRVGDRHWGLRAHAGERYDAAQTLTIVPVKPNPNYAITPPPKPKPTILPPVEFDYPYTGKHLTIETVATREELKPICGNAFTKWTLACAFSYGNTFCRIVIVEESIIKAYGWTKELVMRHEMGHCNGWPKDHPGERPYDGK
jgi:hypothetical protein